MTDYNFIVDKIIEFGASGVNIINVSDIEFKPELRQLCIDNRCGNYGLNYTCPPYVGTSQELIEKVKQYRVAIVIHNTENINGFKDKNGIAIAEQKINKILVNLNRFTHNKNLEYMIIGATSCKICNPCKIMTKDNCPYKEEAFISLSAFCIDVEKLANKCNISFNWEGKTITNIGILLIK